MYTPIWIFIDVLVFDILDHKLQISGPVARQPSLLWQPFCDSLVGGSSSCWLPRMKFMWLPVMELWHILP